MRLCNKCNFNNSDNSTFCVNCGEKLSNEENRVKKKKTKKIIIGACVSLVVGILICTVCIVIFFFNAIGNGIDNISDKVNDYKEKEQERENIYDSIPKELLNKGLISNDWKYVSTEYGWRMEWVDRTDKYYFYIDSNKYDEYKSYWLEDVDKTEYKDDYNSDLVTYGDYVFKAINVNDLSYTSDVEYENVHLTANKTYYLVKVYNEAIYYKYLSEYNVHDESKYYTFSAFNCKGDSLSSEYIFYQEDNQWVIEEIIR